MTLFPSTHNTWEREEKAGRAGNEGRLKKSNDEERGAYGLNRIGGKRGEAEGRERICGPEVGRVTVVKQNMRADRRTWTKQAQRE